MAMSVNFFFIELLKINALQRLACFIAHLFKLISYSEHIHFLILKVFSSIVIINCSRRIEVFIFNFISIFMVQSVLIG